MSAPKGWHFVPCDGGAHEDGNQQDHCSRCAPFWCRVLVPENFETAEAAREWYAGFGPRERRLYHRRAQRAASAAKRAERLAQEAEIRAAYASETER